MLALTVLYCAGLWAAVAATDGTIACDPALRPVLVTATSTIISSPGFTDSVPYPPNQLCQYHIIGSPTTDVVFDFAEANLENSQDCNNDYIKIYEGSDNTGPLRATICGTNNSPFTESTFSEAFVEFRSDSSGESLGFQALIRFTDVACETQDGKTLTERSGWVASPNYGGVGGYPTRLDCYWFFEGGLAGEILEIDFSEFSVGGQCAFAVITDYLEFWEGDGRDRVVLNRFHDTMASTSLSFHTRTTPLGKMYMFSDSNVDNQAGFNFTYRYITP